MASRRDTPLDLATVLTEVARLLRADFLKALDRTDLGVSPGEARTLFYLSRLGGSNQRTIAKRMLVEPMTLVGFLNRLEARGLIERTADPADRRARIVKMTPAAAPLIGRIEAVADQIRNRAMANIPVQNRAKLLNSLNKMRESLAGPSHAPSASEGISLTF